jgi:prevent-host-death family protein
MSNQVTAFEAKNRLGRLLDRVHAGEEITITRHGEPVAKLIPAPNGGSEEADRALAAMKRIRETLVKKGTKVSRREVRNWVNEGRR